MPVGPARSFAFSLRVQNSPLLCSRCPLCCLFLSARLEITLVPPESRKCTAGKRLALRRKVTVLGPRFVPLSIIILEGRRHLFFFFLTPLDLETSKKKNTQPQRIHFRKEDERLLRKLLAKVKAQADTVSLWGGTLWSSRGFFVLFFFFFLRSLSKPLSLTKQQQTKTKNRPTSTRPRALRPRRSWLSR